MALPAGRAEGAMEVPAMPGGVPMPGSARPR